MQLNEDVFNSLLEHIAIIDQTGTIIAVNDAWRRFIERDNVHNPGIGVNYFAVCDNASGPPPDDKAATVAAGLRAVSQGKLPYFEVEYPCHPPNEEQQWFLLRATPLKTQDGTVIVSHTNITRLKQAELAYRESELRFRRSIEQSPNVIYIFDLNHDQPVYMNRDEFLGYTLDDLEQPGSFFHAVNVDDLVHVINQWQQVTAGQQPAAVEYRLQASDGHWEWVQSHAAILTRHDDGTPAQIMVTLAIITAHKRIEEELHYQASLFQQVSDAVIATDLNRIITSWNDAATKIYGWTEAEAIGHNIDVLLKTEWTTTTQPKAYTSLRETGRWTGPVKQWHKAGHILDIWAAVSWVYDHDKNIVAGVTVNRDITPYRNVTAELAESQALFQQVIASMSDHIYVTTVEVDGTRTNKYLSPNLDELVGYPLETILTDWNFWATTLIHPDDRRKAATQADKLAAGQSSEIEYRLVQANNKVIWVRDSARVVTQADGRRTIYGVVSDITSRKQVEQNLEESLNLAENLIVDTQMAYDIASIGHWTFDPAIGIPEWTEQIYDIYERDPALGPPRLKEYKQIYQGEHFDTFWTSIQAAVKEGKPYNITLKLVLPSGSEKWVRAICQPNPKPGPAGHFLRGTIQDITASKLAQEHLQQRNQALEFLNRVGQMLVSTLDLEAILANVLEETRHLLDAFGCSAWLLDPGKGTLVCFQATRPHDALIRGWVLDASVSMEHWVIEHGHSVLIPDTRLDPRFYTGIDTHLGIETRSIMLVPLRVKDKIIGVFTVTDRAVNRFTTDDLSLLESLAATTAIAIDNARLFEQEQHQRQATEDALRETRLLHRISSILAQTRPVRLAIEQVLGAYLEALGLKQGGITLFDSQKQEAQLYALYRDGQPQVLRAPIKIISPAYKKLTQTQQPLVILDAVNDQLLVNDQDLISQHHIQSMLLVPLLVQGQVVGALGADSVDQPRTFADREIELAQAVASQIAGAFDRIRLDEAQQRLTAVVEQAGETIVITDLEGHIVYANPHFETSSGYTIAEAMRQPPNILKSGHQDSAFYEGLWATITAGQSWHGTFINKRKDGTLYHEDANIFPIKNAAGEIINYAAVKRDITDRVQAEQQLRLLEAAMESTNEGIIITNSHPNWLEATIVFVNQGFCQIAGYNRDALLGQTPDLFYGPESDTTRLETLNIALAQGQIFYEESISYRQDETTYQAIWHIAPIFNSHREITHYVALVQDVTAMRQLEAQFRQSQKMEAIGRLAGGIAHDFNNILTIIIGHVEFLLMLHPAEDDPLYPDIMPIKRAAERAAELTRQLLAFSRRQVLQPRRLNLNELVTNLEKMLGRLIRENIELRTALAPELEPIDADPGQLEQVIMNLVVNARDAMPNGGHLTIETSNIYLNVSPTLQSDNFVPGPYILLTVSDTGVGMDATTQERVFEPFFTTKPKGEGTGLGLATVHGIVAQSRGHLDIKSKLGHGTCVKVYLPRAKQARPPVEPKQPVRLRQGQETILLVEDETNVRQVAYQTLSIYGYTILLAANGKEALQISDEYHATIDLLLTDVILPGSFNGAEVARILSSRRPAMKTMFISGYAEAVVLSPDKHAPFHFMQKPFAPADLVTKVQEVLSTDPPTAL